MLAIIVSRNANSYRLPNFWKYDFSRGHQLQFPELEFPEMLAILIFRNVGKHMFRNTGYKC